ncbi:MAG: tetratricopeptide repeat protein [Betaproteobacteria bacterium]|nr:tetratricopeptide repeat protein [Betaproteobacteria bacterium]
MIRSAATHVVTIIATCAFAWPLGASSHSESHAALHGTTAQPKAAIPLYRNLGDHHYAITTESPQAQRYFDQGLRLYYAFNHQEAIRAFEEAARLDPKCAMCPWGSALALGPNINAPMAAKAALAAFAAIGKAAALAGHASPREQALIHALAARYAEVPPEDRAALDRAYAEALREVVRRHPQDLEARTLYAEALMDLSPWNYWTRDGKPRESTPELLAQLEYVMKANPDHPGANHFYIHAVEAVQPERAVAAAERLVGLMPGAGHIVHMPGHIYVRVGRYADAIRANEHAIHADESYIRDQNPAAGVYVAGYYPHNYDFLAFAAAMIGRQEQAISAAEKIATLVAPEMLRAPGMLFTQNHLTRHLQLKVRFGLWDEILQTKGPQADLKHASAMWHYARGRAHAAKGMIAAAESDLVRVRAARDDESLAPERLEFNTSGQMLGIAAEVLAGHIAQAKGDRQTAVSHLYKAAQLEDELVYGEPPEWSVPVRQELGRVLLEAGRYADAERAFKQDLKRFPKNTWSLEGLQQASNARARSAKSAAVTSSGGESARHH